MAVQFITTSSRPSTDIPWTNNPDGTGWYMKDPYFLETWLDKGRLISTTTTYSEDGLAVTVIRIFSDWQALDDFISDTELLPIRIERNKYLEEVGIETIDIETKEV